jgi:hypothetical protein
MEEQYTGGNAQAQSAQNVVAEVTKKIEQPLPREIEPASEGAEARIQKPLTPEEQMALYEKELKESDWGHQPC